MSTVAEEQIAQAGATEPSEQFEELQIDRRRALKTIGVSGVLAALGILPSGCDRSEAGWLETPSEEALRVFEEKLKECCLTGTEQSKIPGTTLLNDLFLQKEHALFLQADGDTTVTYQAFVAGAWERHHHFVASNLEQERQSNPDERDPLMHLGQALFKALDPKLQYNATHNSILSPVCSDRLQCRSGTQLFLLHASTLLSSEDLRDGRLVVIYTDTHELPGIVTKAGKLVGYEITLGGARVEFGYLKKVDFPMQVCDADLVRAEMLGFSVAHEAVVLLDTVPDFSSSAANVTKLFKPMVATGERHGFSSGKVNIPTGDRPLWGERSINRSRYSEPAGESLVASGRFNNLPTAFTEKEVPFHERQIVYDYFKHNEYFNQCYDRYLDTMRSNKTKAVKVQVLHQLVVEMVEYYNGNKLRIAVQDASAVLKRYNIRHHGRDPGPTFDYIKAKRYELERGHDGD
ncbi:hypothetical protein OAO01_03195 [Oligoflexia bacterium]|nr:hypothetical protein [Oligoflexia bacterium]